MIESWSPTLKERSDDHYTQFFGQGAIQRCRWSRNGLSEIEIVHTFYLTEIERVMQLLEHNELCSPMRQISDTFLQSMNIVIHVCRIVKL